MRELFGIIVVVALLIGLGKMVSREEREPPMIETTCTDIHTGHTTVNHGRGAYYGQVNAVCSHKVVEK